MKTTLTLNGDEITTLWLLSLLNNTILKEGMTRDNYDDLEELNAELKAIIARAGLGEHTNKLILLL